MNSFVVLVVQNQYFCFYITVIDSESFFLFVFFYLCRLFFAPPPKKALNGNIWALQIIKQQTSDHLLLLSFARGLTRFGTFPIWISKELHAVPLVTSIDRSLSRGAPRGRHQREHVLEVVRLLRTRLAFENEQWRRVLWCRHRWVSLFLGHITAYVPVTSDMVLISRY